MKKLSILLLSIIFFSSCQQKNKIVDSSSVKHSLETSSSQIKDSDSSSTVEETDSSVYSEGSLLDGVSENDVNRIKEILKDPTYNINEVNEKMESPLLISTHYNQIEIAKLLIDAGADVNQQDNIDDSPYLYAGAEGRTEILSYMLTHTQPDQATYNRFGGNALIPAAEKGHLDNVRLLLEDGRIDINHQNNHGYSALIEAVALTDGSSVYQDIVLELLQHGADKNLEDNQGKTAMDYAKELGYNQIVELLK